MAEETNTSGEFSDMEKALMKERAKELKAEARVSRDRAIGEQNVMEAIAAMTGPDREMAEKIHELVKTHAPHLAPKMWYGMPAYAKDGKVICFFQSSAKFKVRYSTFGFQPDANLDRGNLWPVAYAVTQIGAAEEAEIIALVKRAAS